MAEREFEGRDISAEVKALMEGKREPGDANTRPKVERVTSGHVHQKQDNLALRFIKELVPNGDIPLGEYLWQKVLIPTVRGTILDIIHMAFGVSGPSYKSGSSTRYSDLSRDWNYSAKQSEKKKRPYSASYKPVIVDTRRDAERILDGMEEILARYDVASVSDLYQLAGIPVVSIDSKFGWYSIEGSRIVYVSDGYMVKLPDPEPL